MPQSNAPCSIVIYPFHVPCMVAKKQFIRYFSIRRFSARSIKSVPVAIVTVGLTASTLIGCSDLSAQTPTTVSPANAGMTLPSQSLEKTQSLSQAIPSEQPPEQQSVWVTLANMRCH